MEKVRTCVAIVLIIICFVGCGTYVAPPRNTAKETNTVATPTPDPVYAEILGMRPNINFGMSENEVRQNETYGLDREFKGEISYKIPKEKQVFGFDRMYVDYAFNSNNQLTAVTYGLSSFNKKVYTLDTYKKIVEIISEGEGEISETKMIWSDKHYENQPDNWDKAFGMGHYEYAVYWENKEYKLIFAYSSQESRVQYQTKKYKLR